MNKEKRNITTKLETESKYLTNILDKEDVKEFKKLIPELQDTWHKKQMFRTETEMRFSVLSDNKYPTRAAKYWQCVREQNTHFENLMHLSFDARKNEVEIKKLQRDIKKEKDPLEVELKQIELEEKIRQKKINEDEIVFLRLNYLHATKCTKTFFNNLYKVGTDEYKACILRKGKKAN